MSNAGPGRFHGKTALVTGAGSGIGLAVANEFVSEGARVIGVDARLPDLAEKTSDQEGILWAECDVTVLSEFEEAVSSALDSFGQLDVLVNVAGIAVAGSATELDLDKWDAVLAVNLSGVFIGTKSVLPQMVKQGSGAIINVASTFGLVAQPRFPAYCASKAGVIGLTRQVALDYASAGIRCNCVCPGPTATPNIERHYGPPDEMDARGRYLVSTVPMGRLARPAEIARAILFLASEDASYINGTALAVDGGQSMHTGPVWGAEERT